MKNDALIERLLQVATFEVSVEMDDTPVRGNALCSGDDDADRRVEDEILERLNQGDPWAWGLVYVRATFAGFTGEDFLGGCSYASEEDFRTAGDYFEDMTRQACLDLLQMAESARRHLLKLDGLRGTQGQSTSEG